MQCVESKRLNRRPPPRPGSRRVNALFGAPFLACIPSLLGAGGAAAVGSPAGQDDREQAPERQPKSAGSAALRGRVTASGRPLEGVEIVARNMLDGHEDMARTETDGTFVIAPLPPGIYEVEGSREGFSIASQSLALPAGELRQTELVAEPNETAATVGVISPAPTPLRRSYDTSDLVAAAVVGRSIVTSRHDDYVEVLTDLHLESTLKGSGSGRDVVYRHAEYEMAGGEPGPWRAELAAGTRVLAFLGLSKTDLPRSGKPIFQAADEFGLRALDDSERAAYLARLDALERLERQAERRGGMNPAALVEWFVATAENPLTRVGATAELESALDALDWFAGQAGTSAEIAAEDLKIVLGRFHDDGGTVRNEPAPLLGALLTAEHKRRLTAALQATEALGQGDRELFELVRRWDEAGAREWLLRQLRTAKPNPEADARQLWWLLNLADDLNDDALRPLVAKATEQKQEIEDRWPEDGTQKTRGLLEQALAALAQELRHDFAAALASER